MKWLIIFSVALVGPLAQAGKECTYSFDDEKSVLEGTGYKFTEKAGVTGKLLKFSHNKKSAKSIKDLLNGLEVTVDLMSLDTNNALRDKNMREAFFSFIKENTETKVKVKEVKKNKLESELTLNGVTKPIQFTYEIKGEKVTAKGSFDAMAFVMGDAIAALKKRCGSLHTGSDGKSVTWSDFAIAAKAVVKKTCK